MSSKKEDYTKSPALAFLTSAKQADTQKPETVKQDPAEPAPRTEHKAVNELSADEITKLIAAGALSPEEIASYIQRINPDKKSRRVQLVLKPYLYEQAKRKADSLHKSFNEFIESIIIDYLDRN